MLLLNLLVFQVTESSLGPGYFRVRYYHQTLYPIWVKMSSMDIKKGTPALGWKALRFAVPNYYLAML